MFVNTTRVNNIMLDSNGGSVALEVSCSSDIWYPNGCGSMGGYSFYSMFSVICVAHLNYNYYF